jgi:hypothetical protein
MKSKEMPKNLYKWWTPRSNKDGGVDSVKSPSDGAYSLEKPLVEKSADGAAVRR